MIRFALPPIAACLFFCTTLGASATHAQFPLGVPTDTKPDAADAPNEKRAPTARASGPCATPRRALIHWLGNLAPGATNLDEAVRCLARGDLSRPEAQKRAKQLKRVLDARGIYVKVADVPDEPNYEDPVTGEETVSFTSLIPDMSLTKQADGRWAVSKETLAAVPALHRSTFRFNFDAFADRLPDWMTTPVLGVSLWQLFMLLVLFVLGWIVRAVVARLISSQVLRVMRRLGISWGKDLIYNSALPAGMLAMSGVYFAFIPSLDLDVRLARFLVLAVTTLAAVSVVVLLYRLVDVLSAYMAYRASATETKLDDQLTPLVRRALKLVVVVLGILFVLSNLEIDVTSIIATFGVGSIAIALAAKDTVQNIFGSVTIFLDKPFQIGDWVVTCGVEGVVEEVGFRTTRIRTFANSLVTVPNGKFTDAIVDNFGKREFRRCSIRLRLEHSTSPEQVEAFCDGVRAVLKAHPAVRKDYYEVHFAGFADSALEIMLYFFFEVPDWSDELRARHEVYLDLLRLAASLKVRFAFPTTSVHVESIAEAHPINTSAPPTVATLKQTVDDFGPGGAKVVEPGQRVHPGFYAGQ